MTFLALIFKNRSSNIYIFNIFHGYLALKIKRFLLQERLVILKAYFM